MKASVAMWIDHTQAILVFVRGEDAETRLIDSNVGQQQRPAGGSVPADDKQQRIFTEHLNHFYDKVISALRSAGAILIMGPGEAKGELKKRIERIDLNKHHIEIEPADRMTDPEIVAKAREYALKQVTGHAAG